MTGDAGLTILELLIVLAIMGLMAGLTMTGMRQAAASPPDADDIRRFVAEIRNDALLSGEQLTISLAPTALSTEGRTLQLTVPGLLRLGQQDSLAHPVSLVVSADGVISGPRIWLTERDGTYPLFIWNALGGGND